MTKARKSLKRGRSSNKKRERTQRALVVVGGKVTEKEYFELLRGELGASIDVRAKGCDPVSLTRFAISLLRKEKNVARTAGGDGYKAVLVVTDVDDFSAEQLKGAQRECEKEGMVFVVSNPCFEVWLVDHVRRCPDGACTPQSAQDLTADLGLVAGNRQKHIERQVLRERLDSTDFAPWTDMPLAIEALR